MVTTLTLIYCIEESILIQGLVPGIVAALQELVWGQNNRSVAQPAEYFRRGGSGYQDLFMKTLGG